MFSNLFFFSECPYGTYGDHCEQNCDCEDDILCDPLNGRCLCPAGKIGERCENGEYIVTLTDNISDII